MKWFMALLAVVALGEAGLSVCASGHAHAQMATLKMGSDEAGHAHHAHHDHHATDCDDAVESEPVIDVHCPDCAAGLSCGECAMLTATRVAGFNGHQPLPIATPTEHYAAVALRRPTHFDPPPPKVLTTI